MSLKNYFYYDEENCEFVPVKYNQLERIVYTASVWLLCGVVLAGIGISILSFSIGTPAEIALKAENEALKKQLRTTQTTIDTLDRQVDQLAKADNEMYRSMLGLETIPMDERKAGTGGADLYSDFDIHSQGTAEILKETAQNLENLQRSISIQESSFEEIQSFYNENQKKMVHLPAIKPTQGDVVSGFGKRYHPILKYRRQHDGLDFKANIGDQIYATGNGVVKHAGRKGTYGRLLIIDHGYGYETYYAHLSSFAKDIRPGTRVERGQLVAYSGNTGMSSGPHLHYEIHKDGHPLDPLNFLFADVSPEEYSSYKRITEQSQMSMD